MNANISVTMDLTRTMLAVLFIGAAEIGQGAATVLSQMCAETLGIPLARVRIRAEDSDISPIDLGAYRRIALHPRAPALTEPERQALRHNVELCRDAIICFTAVADARGLGGHTGGPYDVVPEAVLAEPAVVEAYLGRRFAERMAGVPHG